ncbi:hypothetical protein LB579_31445 [Mesorhizobium sp. BR1-1-7]|uniref:hypothetical protein n=1 Tax=Mesorhizobium sp. BR1-1-7 TaxID=2876647 RepID=UPI001CCC5A97|nr:hypothetical protein [Mesorhizobium sp. BR1-1-7]MBZ9922198.1 hypothetical protein [Mesorhizobium sp. BR1-1-7]
MREYVRIAPRSADIDSEPDGENYLARTVFEDFELFDTGVLDADGNKVMARQKLDPIGFIRHKGER